MSNSLRNRNFTKFKPSFVEKGLFGKRKITREVEEPLNSFDPPWISGKDGKKQLIKPLLFYCPTLATSEQLFLAKAEKTEIAISTAKSRPPLARNKQRRMKFTPSYVDESLFKSKRQNDRPPNFEPSWVVETDKRQKYILWDYSGDKPVSSTSHLRGGLQVLIQREQRQVDVK